jgi:phosphoglycolate phosphatase
VDVAIGQRKGVPLKPQPDMVNLALEALGVSNDEAIYVGDSEVDVATARNTHLPCTAVLWGFRTKEELLNAGANQFISEPLSLLHSL